MKLITNSSLTFVSAQRLFSASPGHIVHPCARSTSFLVPHNRTHQPAQDQLASKLSIMALPCCIKSTKAHNQAKIYSNCLWCQKVELSLGEGHTNKLLVRTSAELESAQTDKTNLFPAYSPESSSLLIHQEQQLLLRRAYSPWSDKFFIKIHALSILNILEPFSTAAVGKYFLKPPSCCFYRVFQISHTARAISPPSS